MSTFVLVLSLSISTFGLLVWLSVCAVLALRPGCVSPVGVCKGQLVGSVRRWRLVVIVLALVGLVPVVRVSGSVVLSRSLVFAPRACALGFWRMIRRA